MTELNSVGCNFETDLTASCVCHLVASQVMASGKLPGPRRGPPTVTGQRTFAWNVLLMLAYVAFFRGSDSEEISFTSEARGPELNTSDTALRCESVKLRSSTTTKGPQS